MKKTLLTICMFILFLLATAAASQATTLWQIGFADDASTEFVTDIGTFVTDFKHDFGLVGPPLAAGQFNEGPGYIYSGTPLPVSDSFVANRLHISFSTSVSYSELILNYGRAGSEINSIFLDGGLIADLVGPGEGIWNDVSLSLKNVDAGQHTLTVAYSGGGSENGNYLDYIELENGKVADVPEPATLLFIGSGLLGIGAVRRKLKK